METNGEYREELSEHWHLSEGDQAQEAREADCRHESGHPAEPRVLVAPRHVGRRVPGELVRLLVQAQQRGAEPTCNNRTRESVNDASRPERTRRRALS